MAARTWKGWESMQFFVSAICKLLTWPGGRDARLDDSLAAGAQHGADGAKVGRQVLVPHRLYHLAAHHLQHKGQELPYRHFASSVPSNWQGDFA